MTREAKIGMLTGLIVIVLIGVLLSEYLGNGPAAGGPTGARMAALPIGAGYREQVSRPVGVPSMDPVHGTNQGETAQVVTALGDVPPPAAFASEKGSASAGVQSDIPLASGPRVGAPVAPVPAGPAPQSYGAVNNTLPTIEVADTPVIAARPSLATTQYTVKQGDTLSKIAMAVYKSSKSSNVARIVAANPKILKDSKSVLMVNQKLEIPSLPADKVASDKVVAADGTQANAGGTGGVHVPLPGPLTKATSKAVPAKKSSTYQVKSGDTLEKIAKKFSPDHASEEVTKIMSANGIKNARDLQAGTTLKVPA